MTAWLNAQTKPENSVGPGAAFYPCCALTELLVAKVYHWGASGIQELSTGTCMTGAGIEPGILASELSEEHRSHFPCPMTAGLNARIKSSVGATFYPCCTLAELLVAKV
jgi:hypothetical protein